MPRVHVPFAPSKMGKGFGKRFHQLARLLEQALRRQSFFKNASSVRFSWGKVYDLSLDSWLHGKHIYHDNRVVKCDATVRQMPHIFCHSRGLLHSIFLTNMSH